MAVSGIPMDGEPWLWKVHPPIDGRCGRCGTQELRPSHSCRQCGLRLASGLWGDLPRMRALDSAWRAANRALHDAWIDKTKRQTPVRVASAAGGFDPTDLQRALIAFCEQCGTPLRSTARFCGHCGAQQEISRLAMPYAADASRLSPSSSGSANGGSSPSATPQADPSPTRGSAVARATSSTGASPTPGDAAKEIVVEAFRRGAELAATDERFVKLARYAMQLVGLELARNVAPGERAAFCVPVQVDNGSKVNPGAVLLLEHRVVVAWSEAVLHPTPRSSAFALADIADVRSFQRKVGKVSAQLDAISFSAHERAIEVILHSAVSNKRLAFMIVGTLNGSIRFSRAADRS